MVAELYGNEVVHEGHRAHAVGAGHGSGIGTSEHEVGSQFRDEEERRAAGGIKRQFESGSASPDDLDEAAALVSTDRHDLEAVATQSEAEPARHALDAGLERLPRRRVAPVEEPPQMHGGSLA